MVSQIRRAATSISANIAEGWGRHYSAEFIQFLRKANGSRTELETHLIVSAEVGLCNQEAIKPLISETTILGKQLVALERSLRNGKRANRPLARNTIRHSLFATRRFRDPVAQSLRSRVRLGPFPAGRGAAPGTRAGPCRHRRRRARTRAGPRGDPGNRLPLHLRRRQEPAGRGPLPRRPLAGEPHGRQAADVPRPPDQARRLAGGRVRPGRPQGRHPGQGLRPARR